MKLWTLTNDYAEVIIDGQLIKAEIELIGNKKVITIYNKSFFVNKL